MVITKNPISRKLVIISLAVLLYASSLLGSYNRSAHAVAPAIPLLAAGAGAGYAAMGAYVLGGLIVAGGAAALGVEHADEIYQGSVNAFNKFDSANKALWTEAARLSVEAGKSTIELTDSLKASLDSVNTYIADEIFNLLSTNEANLLIEKSADSPFYGTETYKAITNEYFPDVSWTFKENTSTYTNTQTQWRLIEISYPAQGVALQYNDGAWTTLIDRYPNSFPNIMTDYYSIDNYASFLTFIFDNFGGVLTSAVPQTKVPAIDVINNNVDTAINDLSGFNEVNIPLDNFLATNAVGQPVSLDSTTGAVLNPDGTTYTGDLTWDFPIPFPSTIPAIGSPAVPISTVTTGNVPFVGTPTIPPATGGGSNPFNGLVPVAFLMAFLDVLRAILMYLSRMFTFIMTIPLIPEKNIDNTAFEWFKSAQIVGVHIYTVVSSLASVGLSFAIYRSIRKLLP